MRRFSKDIKTSIPQTEYSAIYGHFINQSRRLDTILSGLNQFDDQKKPSVNEMKNCIKIVLSSNYSNIIENCKRSISISQLIISKEKEIKLSAFAHDILLTSISIMQIVAGKSNLSESASNKSIQTPRPPEFSNPHTSRPKRTKNNMKKLDRAHSLSNLPFEINIKSKEPEEKPSLLSFENDDNGFVVCRICDEKIPVSLIEKHMIACAKVFNSASSISNINNQLNEIIKDTQKNHMETKWPGTSQISTTTLIPLLKIVTLTDHALQIDVNLKDSQDGLNRIINTLNRFKTDGVNNVVVNVLKSVRPLVKQKLRASNEISNRDGFVKSAISASSNSFRPQAQISDFDFVKRISKGAYATVYLARKKKTGDIYAIKVIPKSSLKNDSQIKRVIAEKNILLQLKNPFIVKFCM